MEKGDIKTLRLNRAGKNIITGGLLLGSMQALALAAPQDSMMMILLSSFASAA